MSRVTRLHPEVRREGAVRRFVIRVIVSVFAAGHAARMAWVSSLHLEAEERRWADKWSRAS